MYISVTAAFASEADRKLAQHYTRTEVARILGVGERRLNYWERLRLVQPRTEWGERFYTFRDLVAVKTILGLTAHRVPARRLRRAIVALREQLQKQNGGTVSEHLAELRVVSNGRQVAVVPPRGISPLEPLTGQFVLNFDTRALAGRVHALGSRTAEDWFQLGLSSDAHPDTWQQAVEAYARAIELAPNWVEAHINRGATLYQLGRMADAESAFRAALERDPENATVHFNLGCVLDELQKTAQAVIHLRRAVELQPDYADAHFNLALGYDKRGRARAAQDHWKIYLQLQPSGAWADYARARLAELAPRRSSPPIPFAL